MNGAEIHILVQLASGEYQETLDNYYVLQTSGERIVAPFGETHQCAFWDESDRQLNVK